MNGLTLTQLIQRDRIEHTIRRLLRFFALRMTVEPKIPGAVIPPRVFTQPGSSEIADIAVPQLRADRRHSEAQERVGRQTGAAGCSLVESHHLGVWSNRIKTFKRR